MNKLREQVEKFYRELWDAHNKTAMPAVLHEDFTFRGSLGQEKRGHKGFAEYVDMVHQALGEYRCVIEDLVIEEPKVFARMSFSGMHQGDFMGFAPTGQRVTWSGSALFTFVGEKVSDVWVLGDLKALEQQLKQNQMQQAYVIGNVTVINDDKWSEYRSKVGVTLAPWGGELVFRGSKSAVLGGEHQHSDNVVIRFPNMQAVNNWFGSDAYQALIPLRMQAANIDLISYQADN